MMNHVYKERFPKVSSPCLWQHAKTHVTVSFNRNWETQKHQMVNYKINKMERIVNYPLWSRKRVKKTDKADLIDGLLARP